MNLQKKFDRLENSAFQYIHKITLHHTVSNKFSICVTKVALITNHKICESIMHCAPQRHHNIVHTLVAQSFVM